MPHYSSRQAILDTQNNTVGYEVLSSAGLGGRSLEVSTMAFLQDSSLLASLPALVNDRTLYLPADPRPLSGELADILPAERTVVQVPAQYAANPAVIESAMLLQGRGFRIALDGATMDHIFSPLAKIANLAKIDVSSQWLPSWRMIAKRFTHTGTPMIAANANTPQDIATLCDLGFGYFQGTYFCQPVPVGPKTISTSKASILAVLTELRKPELDLDALARALSADLALTHKLLTLVNSAAVGLRQHVTSVRHAAGMLGAETLRKWLSVAAVSHLAHDKPEELVLHSLVRAAFCETFAIRESLSSRSGELYLMGLFSLIDAILDRPMAEILDKLPLAPVISEALLGRQNAARMILDLVIAYERANWAEVEQMMEQSYLQELDLAEAYRKAVVEAAVALR